LNNRPRTQANVHTTNRDAVSGFIDETVRGSTGVNAILNSVPRALSPMKLKKDSLNIQPNMLGDFFRRAHLLHAKLFNELREQALFYSPQLHSTLGKLWNSNDRIINDMTNHLDTQALHIKSLQIVNGNSSKNATLDKSTDSKVIRKLHSDLRQANQEIHSLKAKLKVVELEGKQRASEKEKIEEMLYTYAYGADATNGNPDWEKEITVLEESSNDKKSKSPTSIRRSKSPKMQHKERKKLNDGKQSTQYLIHKDFLSPSVVNVLDMSHLRTRKWHVYDVGSLCHKIMTIYVSRINNAKKKNGVVPSSPKQTRMRDRRGGEISPVVVTAVEKNDFMKFVASYFENQMNVKTLGDWYTAQLMLNTTRHHDEKISNAGMDGLQWFDYRIILFGKFTGAFSLFPGESRKYDSIQCLNILLTTIKMICQMSASVIDLKSLSNEASNQNIYISYARICEPVVLNLFSKIFNLAKEHLHDILAKLANNAHEVAAKIMREKRALLQGFPDESKGAKRKGRRKSTMTDGVIRSRPNSATQNKPISPTISADKVEMDYLLFTIVNGYSHFKRIRKMTLVELFDERRMKEAKHMKMKMLQGRKKKKIHMAESETKEEKTESKIAINNDTEKNNNNSKNIKKLKVEEVFNLDDAKREAEKEEDTVDAIELGLLPWADCLKMVTYLKDMTEKMTDEELKLDKDFVDPRISNIMAQMNLLANDNNYWKSLIDNGVYLEAKKRALEKEIRQHKKQRSDSNSPSSRNKKNNKNGHKEELQWKSFTEDDIDMLISTRKVSPGIDGKTFAEIVMFYKIGWHGTVI